MHEASLVKALLRQVEDLMRENSASNAQRVNVTVGEFSGVEPDLLEAAFERQSPGTSAAGACLCVKREALMGACGTCGCDFHIERFRFCCCRCGSDDITVIGGEELLLESVVMEAVL